MLTKLQGRSKRKKYLLDARDGDLDKVAKYLKKKPHNINLSNSVGLTSLHLASKGGHTHLVSYLLHRGADVNYATTKGNTALSFAAFEGNLDVVKELVAHGAAVNVKTDDESFTPLYLASQKGWLEVVEYLVNNGADPNIPSQGCYKPYDIALKEEQTNVVAYLLENEARQNKMVPSAVHMLAKNGDMKALKLLVEDGYDVNEKSKLGFTPLHYATHFGHKDFVSYLIKHGSAIDEQSNLGISALHVASNEGHGDILSILLNANADKELETQEGLTALHCAAKRGNMKELQTLISHGSNIHSKSCHGFSPLHMSVQEDFEECADVLLKNDASIEDITKDGFTPLHIAAYFNSLKSAQFLLDRKCNLDARTKNGLTALDIAKKLEHVGMMSLLQRYGAFNDNSNSYKYKKLPTYLSSTDPQKNRIFTESQILNANKSLDDENIHLKIGDSSLKQKHVEGTTRSTSDVNNIECENLTVNINSHTQSVPVVNVISEQDTKIFPIPIHKFEDVDSALKCMPSDSTINSTSTNISESPFIRSIALSSIPSMQANEPEKSDEQFDDCRDYWTNSEHDRDDPTTDNSEEKYAKVIMRCRINKKTTNDGERDHVCTNVDTVIDRLNQVPPHLREAVDKITQDFIRITSSEI